MITTIRRKFDYLTTSISIAFVLFLVGIFSHSVYLANQIREEIKEQIEVNILFKNNAKEADIFNLLEQLKADERIANSQYVSADEARKMMVEELGEEAIKIVGYNPFPPSIDLYFKPNYSNLDSIKAFQASIEPLPYVKEVYFLEAFVSNVDKNLNIIKWGVLTIALVFLLVSIGLINGTIRLSLYSNRFTIRSMQLVGATPWFIRRPFFLTAVSIGLMASIAAVIALHLFVGFMESKFAILDFQFPLSASIGIYFLIIFLGVFISGISGYMAINRYMRMKLEELY